MYIYHMAYGGSRSQVPHLCGLSGRKRVPMVLPYTLFLLPEPPTIAYSPCAPRPTDPVPRALPAQPCAPGPTDPVPRGLLWPTGSAGRGAQGE